MPVKSIADSRPYEVRWHGRGGQGAITAAKLLAQAAYIEGYKGVTAAPSFGAERRGAPVSASTRVSPRPILVMSQVEEPDLVVVLDPTLLPYPDVTSGLRPGGWLVVNSWEPPEDLKLNGDFSVASADATRVCHELGLVVGGLTIVNTAILGALVHTTRMVSMASIEKVIRERFPDKAAATNLAAVAKTYEATRVAKRKTG